MFYWSVGNTWVTLEGSQLIKKGPVMNKKNASLKRTKRSGGSADYEDFFCFDAVKFVNGDKV